MSWQKILLEAAMNGGQVRIEEQGRVYQGDIAELSLLSFEKNYMEIVTSWKALMRSGAWEAVRRTPGVPLVVVSDFAEQIPRMTDDGAVSFITETGDMAYIYPPGHPECIRPSDMKGLDGEDPNIERLREALQDIRRFQRENSGKLSDDDYDWLAFTEMRHINWIRRLEGDVTAPFGSGN